MSIRKGHFKQQGLDVKLITIRQSDVIVNAIMAGELNFMSVIPTAILASVRGLPIRTIAVNLDNAPYVLVGRPQIKSMNDLKGKKIGVSSLGGMSTLVVREIVARSGLDPERDVTYLSDGGSETRSGVITRLSSVAPRASALLATGTWMVAEPPVPPSDRFQGELISSRRSPVRPGKDAVPTSRYGALVGAPVPVPPP